MHQTHEPETLDIWLLYLSVKDLRDAVRYYPVSRFFLLVRSPSTHAFAVNGANIKEGRVDMAISGKFEGEDIVLAYTVWEDELQYDEKVGLLKFIATYYPKNVFPGAGVVQSVATALKMKVS